MAARSLISHMNTPSESADPSAFPESKTVSVLTAMPVVSKGKQAPTLGANPVSLALEHGAEKLAPMFPLLEAASTTGGGLPQVLKAPMPAVDVAAIVPITDLRGKAKPAPVSLLASPTDLAGLASQALTLVHKQTLSSEEADKVTADTIAAWRSHVNEGFLSYRKTMASGEGGASLDWTDPYPGSALFEDARGNVYIDCLGGFGIFNVGRRHPVVTQAVVAQLSKQALHGQELLDPLRSYAARLFSKITPGAGALSHHFFVNSGAEAVEACLKMALLHTGRKHIVATTNAFHGKTLGALATTSKAVFRAPFLGSMLNVTHVPFNDIAHLRETFKAAAFTGNEIAGFILEPIQGEGGIYVASDEYLRAARALCDEYGACLIFDEVQSGMGRSGKWFASEWSGVVPDLLAMGKAMGGGVMPVAACCGREPIWRKYVENPFLLTTTFGGNPLALAAAIATVNVIIDENVSGPGLLGGAVDLRAWGSRGRECSHHCCV
jgi:putrescine aminotransferase